MQNSVEHIIGVTVSESTRAILIDKPAATFVCCFSKKRNICVFATVPLFSL